MANELESIDGIDSYIARSQESLLGLPRSHPTRLTHGFNMAVVRIRRYRMSHEVDDLDKAILLLTESILLQPHTWLERGPLILRALFLLSSALFGRSELSGLPEGVIYAAKFLRYLRDQPHAAFGGFPPHQVAWLLVDVLSSLVESGANNVMQNIEEMAVICHELLTSGPFGGGTTRIVRSKIRPWVPGQPLDPVIKCLRLARMRKPELRDARLALSFCLCIRYCMTFVEDDYEEACIPQSSVSFTSVVSKASKLHPVFPPLSQSVSAASIGEYEDNKSDQSEFDRIRKMRLLKGFLSGIRDDDQTKIDEVIEKGRTILASSNPGHPFASYLFDSFGQILLEGFKRTKKIAYLNEVISTHRQVFERPSPQFLRIGTIRRLSLSLYFRFVSCHITQDLNEALELISQCVEDRHAGPHFPSDRFRLACFWASVARNWYHPSVSAAYESTMSSMQDTLLFAPTLQLQHTTLAKTSLDSFVMPLDYASYHIESGQLKEAIETLERGRALLWSEMRDLRTSIDQLLQAHPDLAHKFAAVNRDLEELTKSIPPSLDLNLDNGGADDLMAADPFGRLLLKQRRLLEERNKLILQIQVLPGFDSFLTTPSFDTLRSAASSGPVIIINHSIWRSDILILLHNASPSLVPTPDNFFDHACALNEELLDARNKHGPDSDHYNQTLAHVLTELYNLVGKPVIDTLRQLNVPEQSRVWWCPTSVFCSLPLHAMGPIPSDDGGERYFLDLYIPSYTPTLSALIPESDHREPGSLTSGLPSLLLVAHFDVPSPDVSLSEVCEDVKVVQALNTRLPMKSLISESATTTSALDGLQDHQFVHFVCHGTLEARKPFDAGFELHGNERLKLLDVVRSRLPAAEFAFLSACHTAELTDGSSADEGLHLAAAVQYCGFRSVVGTMWAMANQDGPDLAKHFYKSMFPKREQGELVPYYKRSAGALRDAVKKLRKKRGITLERWVNFVHYGA
ncbi:CHAT domain-containing protein [Lactarius psammicola]|nr:CHAT domain-containing protein [Lactarius psammicola]